MSCRHGGGCGCRGRSRLLPAGSLRPSTADAHYVRLDRQRAVVTVVEATLVRIIVIVPAALVNDHHLHLEHGPLQVGDGSRGGTTAAARVGTTGRTSCCAPRRPCPQPCRAVTLSCASCAVMPQLLREEREREKRG
jgi:hypothetical protein